MCARACVPPQVPLSNSLVSRPTLAVSDGLHHRYARNGSGKQPNKSRSRQFRANSDVMGVSLINGVS